MTGPDRIWAWPTLTTALTSIHADDEDLDTYGLVEYVRRDPSVLAALAEVQALIRQAVEAEREACAVMQDAAAAFYDADAERFRGGTNPHHSRKERAELFRFAAAAIRKRGEG